MVLIHLFYVMTLSDRCPLLANINNSINSSCKKIASKDCLQILKQRKVKHFFF